MAKKPRRKPPFRAWPKELMTHVCGHTLGHLIALAVLAGISLLPPMYLPIKPGPSDIGSPASIGDGRWL